ncbi:hypothetical protein HYH03_005098 [Edaphochlamys debaryana]|uniref:tRNA/rRNA methyltransferase SpoU type domain-containing protein n=1 Tax=Edaphochlamys debaryana TaxID=47281 RepID=A0A835Y5T4_9CHLO|nr:hypothetical protein HYH03_005098 [Edaphochlamys debaryana]|eukprot:KAG2496680.1 hypothetical protein HYH03_005098 [Edaphochlamys debaryana]
MATALGRWRFSQAGLRRLDKLKERMHTVTDRPEPRAAAVGRAAAADGCSTSSTPPEPGPAARRGASRPGAWRCRTISPVATAAAAGGEASTAPAEDGAVPGVRLAWHRPDVGVVLVHPQIPQNTGNVARSCAATAAPLHLVGPLGFDLDDRKLKRAGLDYWDSVAVHVHPCWGDFFAFFKTLPEPKRLVAYTVYGDTYYGAPEFSYRPGDWLVFGAETSGLPPEAHDDVVASGGALVKIPIRDTHVRSINLAVAAGVGLFEAIRQLDEQSGSGHEVVPRQSPTLQEVAGAHRDGKPLAPPRGARAA